MHMYIDSWRKEMPIFSVGFSCAFAGERTFSSTWRGRPPNTKGPEVVGRDGRPWTREVTQRWTRDRTDGTTSTVDTAPATVSTNVGPKKSTAQRLVSSLFSWHFHYLSISYYRSTAISLLSNARRVDRIKERNTFAFLLKVQRNTYITASVLMLNVIKVSL